MSKNIEVELRGPLTKMTFRNLQSFFKKQAKLLSTEERFFIDYSTLMKSQGIRNRSTDIRIRATNKIPEIMIKLGDWSDNKERKELSIKGKQGDFDTFVQIFAALGYTKGVQVHVVRQVYRYKSIEFVLVDLFKGFYYLFEAEKMVSSKKEVTKTRNEIKKVLEELQLEVFTDEEFYGHIEKINREVAQIFDFKNYKDNFFKKKFTL